MTNLKNTIWNKRVPQYLGAFVLFFSFLSIFWLSQNAILLGTKAAAGKEPKNVQISNITDTSFTISYLTDDRVLGTISFGPTSSLGSIALDDQDQVAGKPFPHRVHHITLSKLNPSTRYYFSINSDDQTYANNDVPYEIMTALTSTETPSSQPPLAGKLILDSGSPPSEALVYISSDTTQLLSAIVKPDGTYLLPLNALRKKDFSGNATLSPTDKLILLASIPEAQSQATILASQSNAVPLITLSKNYDFSLSNLPLSNDLSASSSGQISSNQENLPLEPDKTTVSSPTIITPETEEKFQDSQPLFKGKALPDTSVEIVIESEQVIATAVLADQYGNWSFRPLTPLAPGNHKITITSPDISGILQTISQSFTVHAQGTRFTEPSVSPIADPTPTASASPTPLTQVNPSPSPTTTPPPTPTEIIPITPTPPVIVTAGPTPTPAPLAPSGNSSAVMAIIIASLSMGLGGILFFLAF